MRENGGNVREGKIHQQHQDVSIFDNLKAKASEITNNSYFAGSKNISVKSQATRK